MMKEKARQGPSEERSFWVEVVEIAGWVLVGLPYLMRMLIALGARPIGSEKMILPVIGLFVLGAVFLMLACLATDRVSNCPLEYAMRTLLTELFLVWFCLIEALVVFEFVHQRFPGPDPCHRPGASCS